MTVNITDHANMNLENDHGAYLMLQRLVAEYGVGSMADALSWVSRNLALNMAEMLQHQLSTQLRFLQLEAEKQADSVSLETTTLEYHCQPATKALLQSLLSGMDGRMALDVPDGMQPSMENRYARERRAAFAGFMHDLIMHGWNETEFYPLAREYAPEETEE